MENAPYLVPKAPPKLLSFVFPVFDEEMVLPVLRQRLLELQRHLPCPMEIIFVNDGSRDGVISGRGYKRPLQCQVNRSLIRHKQTYAGEFSKKTELRP